MFRVFVNFREDVGQGTWVGSSERKISRAAVDRWARWKVRQQNVKSVRVVGYGVNQEFWM